MGRRMLLLVSDQPMANLLAALEPSLDVASADLVVSGEMHANGTGETLAAALEARGIDCRWHQISDPFQPGQTRSQVAALLATAPEEWIVNLTGGTKPMMLGAYRAAIDSGVRDMLYLDHQQGLLRWLEGNRPAFRSTARLGVADVLTAHGYKIAGTRQPSDTRLRLADMLFRQSAETRLALHKLMTDVEKASAHGKKWQPAPVVVPENSALHTLLHELCRRQLLAFNGREVEVSDRDDHQFLAGSWFEHIVFEALRGIGGLDDLHLGLEVQRLEGARNEIDAAAMQGRRLLVVECKAGASFREEKAAQASYRLEHLQRLGGLGTALLLVSLEKVRPGDQKRLEAAGIAVVAGVDPATLAQRLAEALAR